MSEKNEKGGDRRQVGRQGRDNSRDIAEERTVRAFWVWRIFLLARQVKTISPTTMQRLCLTLLSSLCLCLVSICDAEEGLEFPNFDGKDRVLDVNERNYKKALRRYDMLCLFYHEPLAANKGMQKRFQMTELVLEVRKRV